MKRGTLKFIVLVVFIAAVLFGARHFNLNAYLDQERLRQWIEGFGIWGPVVYILTYSVTPALMLPGLPMTVLGGILFGPVKGVLYVSIGSTMGASVAFLAARLAGREWVEGMIKNSRWRELDREVERHGWKIVAFTRLIPLFPYNLLNYAYGLTRIRFSHYVITSYVCMLPAITAYVVFSSSILDLFRGKVSRGLLTGIILIAVVSIIPVLYMRRKHKASHGTH